MLHLVFAFGRWERFREPGLVLLYVLPLVHIPRSEQASCFIFIFRKTGKCAAPQVQQLTSCRVSCTASVCLIGQDSTEPAPFFLVNLTVLVPN